MRTAILRLTGLTAAIVLLAAAAPPLQRGDLVLLSDSFTLCQLTTPPPPISSLSLVSRSSSLASYRLNWPSYDSLAAIGFSDRAGMVISSNAAGGSALSVVQSDGTVSPFGASPFMASAQIVGLAPASTDLIALAIVGVGSVNARGEIWRVAQGGTLRTRMTLPTASVTSLDVAADQCTVYYTTATAIARYDSCRQTPLADFAATDVPLSSVRIAPDGQLLAIDSVHNQLLRFAANGKAAGSYALPLSTAPETPESVTAFAFDDLGANLWIATSFPCVFHPGRLLQLDRTTGSVQIAPPLSTTDNRLNALATVSEWRAALPRPTVRRRAVGR